MFSETRKGGKDEGHGKKFVGVRSKKRYPLVIFGRHHASMYILLVLHVLTEAAIPKTRSLRLVGESVVIIGCEPHLCVKLVKKLEDWQQGWLDNNM